MTLRPVTLTKAVEIEDPNLILTVEAKEKGPQSPIDALMLPHNRDRYIPPDEPDDVESREVTPYSDLEDDNNATETEKIHQLRLTFDRPPTDIGGGFSFGTDKQACDVLLAAKRRQGKISGVHFYITFDEEGRLVLFDKSTQGTAVSYGGWGIVNKRRHFKWILLPGWQIQVHLPNNFTLGLVLAKHETCEAQYRANVTSYLGKSRDAPPPLGILDIQSRDSTALPTEPLSPRSRPIYLPSRTLGRGSFGEVVLVTDVSTANVYAAKVFREGAEFQNEVRIMRSISHMHIVPFVDFVDEHPPQLIMEYLPLGNLEQEHKRSLVTSEEAVILFYQCLQALGHLHANNVTHRDLKPANILVESRDPFRVKLCDFGLAKVADNDNVLKTFCGTFAYCAPEIYLGGSYSPAVDIWSLGVIILEYEYGYDRRGPRIPGGNRRDVHNRKKQLGLAWCKHLVEQANDWDSDPLIDLLSTGMLKIEPKERLSAAECIGRVKEFEPSVDPSFHPGSITSTPRASPISGDDGDSTIKGPLWVSGDAPGDGGNCGLQLGTPAHAPLQHQSVSHLYTLSGEHSEFNNKSSPFHTMYDGVLALLKDLLPTESGNQNVDDNASAMVRRLCECLTSLNITKMAVHNEQPHITTITATSNNREMVVANLIFSEMMNSIEALAGHLLHKLQFQSPPPRSTREFDNPGPSSPSIKYSLTDPGFYPRSTTPTPQTSPINGDDGDSTMERLRDSGCASCNTDNRGSQSSASERASEERDRDVTDGSALQKRPRSPSGSSTPKASDVSQAKRLQRSDDQTAGAGSDTPIQNGIQSDGDYIFDALWKSKGVSSDDHSSETPFTHSPLDFHQKKSRLSCGERAISPPAGRPAETVGEGSARTDSGGLVQEYTFGGHQYRECFLNNVPVRMRVSDKRMCFTHLAQAAGYKKRQIHQFLAEINDEMKEKYIHHRRKGTLIDYNLALEYIDRFGLVGSKVLDRMIDSTNKPLGQQKLTTRATHVRKQYEFNGFQYRAIYHKNHAIYICPLRRVVNATHLFKAAGYSRPTAANKIKELGITVREVIKGFPQLQGTYVDYDDYLRYFSFLGLDATIIPQLDERMEAEGEMENEEEETDEEKEETDEEKKETTVADCAEIAGDLIQLQPSTIIKPYPRTYNQDGCRFYPTLISGTVIYLCPAKRLVNASHLIKAAGYRRQALRKTLETFQISVAQRITGHHKVQGLYLIYDDGLALLRHLGLDEPVDLFAYADCSTRETVLVLPGKEFALGKRHDEKTIGHGTSQAVSRLFGEESESRVAYESSYRSQLVQVFPRLSVPASDPHLAISVENMDRNLCSTSDDLGGGSTLLIPRT